MEIYRHFVDDLDVKGMDFLLPDLQHDTFDSTISGKIGKYLSAVFDTWISDNNPNIKIRFFDYYFYLLMATPQRREAYRNSMANHKVITITSDGTLGHDDILRSAIPDVFSKLKPVSEITIEQYFSGPAGQMLQAAARQLPTECNNCMWADICHGGKHLIHQYSSSRKFDNKSVYCEDMKMILGRMSGFLLADTLSVEQLAKNLSTA